MNVDPKDKLPSKDTLPEASNFRLLVQFPFATNRVSTENNGMTTFGYEPRNSPHELALVYGVVKVLVPVPKNYLVADALACGMELVDLKATKQAIPEVRYEVIGVDVPVTAVEAEYSKAEHVASRSKMLTLVQELVLKSPHQELIRLIHGAGCSPDVAAKICAHMFVRTRRPVLNIDWATQNQALSIFPPNLPSVNAYVKDERNYLIGIEAWQGFESEVEKVVSLDKIFDEGQSLGNRLLFHNRIYGKDKGRLPKAIIWSAADIDRLYFIQRAQAFTAAENNRPCFNVVLYNSANPIFNGDRALQLSQIVHGGYDRLGQTGADRNLENFVSIDMAKIAGQTDPLLGHGENYELDNVLLNHLLDGDLNLPKKLCAYFVDDQKGEVVIENFRFARKESVGNHWAVEFVNKKPELC